MKIQYWTVSLMMVGLFLGGCGEVKKEADTMALNTEGAESTTPPPAKKRPLSQAFKDYWYAGDAEITSYRLEQARYGELREGKAVLIFVTEPFLADKQVKADRSNPSNIPVLKLNKTKKYLTGIYPYSIMNSTFYPVYDNQHAIKTSLSVQEWCGQVYSQLNNRDSFEFVSHSYFEGEADEAFTIEKNHLENEVWNKIRIHPEGLPQGEISMIPALEYFRVQHRPVQAYQAIATLEENGDQQTYTVAYKNTARTLSITFNTAFPHEILSWEETFSSGFGPNAKRMVSKGIKLKSLKTPYWRQNSNAFLHLRDSLDL